MSAGTYNIVIDQGSDYIVRFTLTQGGAPLPLTGYSARAEMRASKSPTANLVETFTCNIANAIGGEIVMSMLNSNTANVTAGKYYWDLEIYTANNADVTRLLQGNVTVTQEITR